MFQFITCPQLNKGIKLSNKKSNNYNNNNSTSTFLCLVKTWKKRSSRAAVFFETGVLISVT